MHSNILPVSIDFLDELYALIDASLHPAIDDLFKKIIIYQLIAQAINTKQIGSHYETSFEVIVNKYEEDGKGKQTPIDFTGTIEIGFTFKDGKEEVMSLPVSHNKATVRAKHAEKPVNLVLDPREKLIKGDEGTSYRLK
jgi:ABC-2 type transport system permease protein